MTRGTFVTYNAGRMTIEAIVRTMHHDGSVTVEARHEWYNGKRYGCYMGYRYRMERADLRVAL